MSNEFAGRHIVVTGGTGALGRAVLEALLSKGARCHVPVFEKAELERSKFASNSSVEFVPDVDLRDEASVSAFYAALPPIFASVQLAGGFAMSGLVETSLEDFRHLVDMNLTTCFLACREAVRNIRRSGEGGRLVNVAARPALIPTGSMLAYSSSKAAVANLTLSLAEELSSERIWVNAVVPSTMDTPANRASMPNADFSAWPKVEEVASTIAFLASPSNAVTRGALVPVYGRS